MPLLSRNQLPSLLQEVRGGKITPVYLFFGERYLCQQAAEQVQYALLQAGGAIHPIDGSQEDPVSTLASLKSFSLLPGRQIFRVNDTRLFLSKSNAPTLWNKALSAYQDNKLEAAARWLRTLLLAGGLEPENPEHGPDQLTTEGWRKLLAMEKPDGDLRWADQLLAAHSPATAGRQTSSDPATLLHTTILDGIPGNNVLFLLTEELDKRKKIFKYLCEQQTVIDCSVDSGLSSGAQRAQKGILDELVREVLRRHNKTLDPGVEDLLFERVGFHPVAVVSEMKKLILSCGARERISRQDLDEMVGRTRQEAVFELTDALGRQAPEQCLLVARRLREHGVHPLALIATLRNYIRNLLLFRALQDQKQYGYDPAMPPALFQSRCLPPLKEQGRWKKELSGHPYALYMQFKTASRFSLTRLHNWLDLLLAAERRLKSSMLSETLVIDQLLLRLTSG